MVEIAIVEDDSALGALLEKYCRRLGHRVSLYENAGSIRAALMSRPPAIALVDLTLPDEPGSQLAVELLERLPALKVILMSGYPAAIDTLLPEALRPRARFLAKPFQASELEVLLSML